MSQRHRLRSCEMPKQKLLQAACYLLCVVLTLRDPYGLSGSEFSGGRVTGRLLDLNFFGFLFLVLALLLTFALPRTAAAVALAASVFCLPLYVYFVAPGPFRRIFKGEWSVPLQSYFVADRWAIESLLALLLATSVSIYTLSSFSKKRPPVGRS
jgi:hypothetical protein